MTEPLGLLEAFLGFEVGQCFRASTRVETSLEIPLTCLLVPSSVLAMFKAVSRVRVASFSRSLVCVRLEFDPKVKASIICSSGLVNLHSSTRIRIFSTNESTDSSGSCFKVLSFYLASRKLLFGER